MSKRKRTTKSIAQLFPGANRRVPRHDTGSLTRNEPVHGAYDYERGDDGGEHGAVRERVRDAQPQVVRPDVRRRGGHQGQRVDGDQRPDQGLRVRETEVRSVQLQVPVDVCREHADKVRRGPCVPGHVQRSVAPVFRR